MRADAALAVVLLAAAAVGGASGPASLEVTVPDDPVRVGDRVPVRVAARGGDGLLWGELRITEEPGAPWEVVEPPREIEGARPPVWELVLVPLEVAELAVPPISVSVRNADEASGALVAENLPTVTVVSVLPENEEVEAVPLRAPVGVSGFPWEWVLPLAVPALAAGLAAAFWWSRRRRAADGGAVAPTVAPLDELQALLDRLEERLGREPVEGICDRLAAGMRRYLERSSGEPAEDMTSFELRLLARRLAWPESVQRGLQEVMAVADVVRFGRMPADESRLRRVLELARETAIGLDRWMAALAAAEQAEGEAKSEAAG